jgi:tetratricopeptide (TPR) repeat protein
MATQHKVYLDHLIRRESLRYQRPKEQVPIASRPKEVLRLSDLQNPNRVKLLRKPDFQRETWAWTPDDCVSLLESIVNDQVIPSIIMWSSPDNGFDYILDGGHRVSVVLAWLYNDWGDNLSSDLYRDDEHERSIKAAAREVREYLNVRVGTISDYQSAESAIEQAMLNGQSPQRDLPASVFKRGYFYQRLLKGHVDLHVLWATGDYEKAEQSFLKINKSGRQLSDWEIKLVDNRNSSFARIVMSVASVSSSRNYWPSHITDAIDASILERKVQAITLGIDRIYDTLFKPSYQSQIQTLQQPLLVAPGSHQRPYYLAELLTVLEGGRGQLAETERLLSQDKNATPEQIIDNGWRLVDRTLDVLDHLVGDQTKSQSLAIVPALYFYTETGRYVRSLLYGFIFWLFAGSDRDVLQRKRAFAAHRSAFEQILIEKKDDMVTGLTRRTGSGPDITAQTAQYFDGILRLLDKHHDATQSTEFLKEYGDFTKNIVSKVPRAPHSVEGRGRIFTDRQRSTVVLRALLSNPVRCGICGGILDAAMGAQMDHKTPFAQGGRTEVGNAQLAHPFCNNNREIIEGMRNGQQQVIIPIFADATLDTGVKQISFFDDPAFNP